MTGQELIAAIKKYGLENFEIETGYLENRIYDTQSLTFHVSDTELPYPKYKDYRFDEPAYIYVTKELIFYPDGDTACNYNVFDTSKEY